MTTISKDGNATEHYQKSVGKEHISTREPVKGKSPKIYIYKYVIANLAKNILIRRGNLPKLVKGSTVYTGGNPLMREKRT